LRDTIKQVEFNSTNTIAEPLVKLCQPYGGSYDQLTRDIANNDVLQRMSNLNPQNEFSQKWLKTARVLTQGQFHLLPDLIDNDLLHLKFLNIMADNETQYKEMLQGLCGFVSYRAAQNSALPTREILFRIYKQIEN
jgi:hypothetical protein